MRLRIILFTSTAVMVALGIAVTLAWMGDQVLAGLLVSVAVLASLIQWRIVRRPHDKEHQVYTSDQMRLF